MPARWTTQTVCVDCRSDASDCGCSGPPAREEIERCVLCAEEPDNCGCRMCNSCNRVRRDDFCNNCDYCSTCCSCYVCQSCNESVSDLVCGDCERCESCGCDCGGGGEVRWVDPEKRFHGTATKRYPRYLGIEIECGVDWDSISRSVSKLREKWGLGTHDDGSISSRLGTTLEVVTAPARGDLFAKQIDDICRVLAQGEAKVDKSCGLHVHVDVRDLNISQILRIVRFYTMVEDSIYRMVPPSRKRNSYSEPWNGKLARGCALDLFASLQDRERALDINSYGHEETARHCKMYREKHESRYHGFNLNAIVCHGTIEFRMHSGTVDPLKIKMWAAVCSAIVEYASSRPEESLLSLKGTPMEKFERAISDREVIAWARVRRNYFIEKERKRRGVLTARRSWCAAPAFEPGPEEASEAA
jgi:hypothetical protein